MQVVVNGLLTNYQKSGEGPVVLLLHGWGDDSSTFKELIAPLTSKYTTLQLDLPGFGGTQVPGSAWGLAEYAGFVSDWSKKISSKKIYAVIGHSNGGAIAINGLSSGSLQADKLVLLASAGVRDQDIVRKGLFKATAKTGRAATAILPSSAQKKLRSAFYKSISSELELMPQLEESFRKIVAEDVQSAAARLKLSTLLIYGDSDKATPQRHGKLLASAIRGSELVIIPDAEHFLHRDQHQHVAELVMDFLAGQGL